MAEKVDQMDPDEKIVDLEFIDQKKITITMGVDLSYLHEHIQKWVYEYYKDNGFLKPVQVEASFIIEITLC